MVSIVLPLYGTVVALGFVYGRVIQFLYNVVSKNNDKVVFIIIYECICDKMYLLIFDRESRVLQLAQG